MTVLDFIAILLNFLTIEKMKSTWDKGGVHSFFNKLTRFKIIPDRDVQMALLF